MKFGGGEKKIEKTFGLGNRKISQAQFAQKESERHVARKFKLFFLRFQMAFISLCGVFMLYVRQHHDRKINRKSFCVWSTN